MFWIGSDLIEVLADWSRGRFDVLACPAALCRQPNPCMMVFASGWTSHDGVRQRR